MKDEKDKNTELIEWASKQSPSQRVRLRNMTGKYNKLSRSQSFAKRSTFFGLGLT